MDLLPSLRRPNDAHGLSADGATAQRANAAAIVGTVAVVAHDVVIICAKCLGRTGSLVSAAFRIKIGFVQGTAVDMYRTLDVFDCFAGKANHPFDEMLGKPS